MARDSKLQSREREGERETMTEGKCADKTRRVMIENTKWPQH